MEVRPTIRHAVRVLLLDEHDRLLLFRAEDPGTGAVFWFPAGGGIEDGEDAVAAARREVAEETGLTDLQLEAEVWHRGTCSAGKALNRISASDGFWRTYGRSGQRPQR
jgi:8-oxo-dGTP pyrophosphatase MutT (NUDIX family)